LNNEAVNTALFCFLILYFTSRLTQRYPVHAFSLRQAPAAGENRNLKT
jgi:hypothetical protein